MAIVQISKIQQRRGLNQDLPQLASGEIGWSIDNRKLYIGNGTIEEGAPVEGHTEILTEFSILTFTNTLQANVSALQANVTILQGNIVTINNQIAALQSGSFTSNSVALLSSTSGSLAGIPASNATISYTLLQGSKQRTGTIVMSRNGTTITYEEDYTEVGVTPTDLTFSMTANTTYGILNYTTTSATNLLYRITTQQ
jgi:Major tropism determinant N-terminal domain